MRWISLLLASAALAAAEPPPLNEARVTLSYPELKALLEASRKEPPPAAPLAFSVLSADYQLTLEKDRAKGTATFEIQNFSDRAELVPLLGSTARVERVEPKDAVLTVLSGRLKYLLEGKSRVRLVLAFTAATRDTSGRWVLDLSIPEAPLSSLTIRGADASETITVAGLGAPTAEGDALRWQLGAAERITVTRETATKIVRETPLPTKRVEAPTIIRSLNVEMRAVRDGSYLAKTGWIIRHDNAVDLTLAMPEDAEILTCQVNGSNAAPLEKDARHILLPIPPPTSQGESQVELTYTARGKAFDPVRGEYSVTLPGAPFLVEKLGWDLEIPKPYETVAIQGNVDFEPSPRPDLVRLKRELGRGDAATVQLFYQKPEKPAKS